LIGLLLLMPINNLRLTINKKNEDIPDVFLGIVNRKK